MILQKLKKRTVKETVHVGNLRGILKEKEKRGSKNHGNRPQWDRCKKNNECEDCVNSDIETKVKHTPERICNLAVGLHPQKPIATVRILPLHSKDKLALHLSQGPSCIPSYTAELESWRVHLPDFITAWAPDVTFSSINQMHKYKAWIWKWVRGKRAKQEHSCCEFNSQADSWKSRASVGQATLWWWPEQQFLGIPVLPWRLQSWS